MYKLTSKIKKTFLLILPLIAVSIISVNAAASQEPSNSTPARPEIPLIANPSETIVMDNVKSFVSQKDSCSTDPFKLPRCTAYPDRSCQTIEYITSDNDTHTIEGCVHKGLSLPSFNNFTVNLNIPGARNGNEQKFLVGRACEGACDTEPPTDYANKTPISGTGLHAEDTVRFQLYAHNNGKDGDPNTTAKNVEVGVYLDNTPDPSSEKSIRPVGFIKSSNAQYAEVTDDMKVSFADYGLVLEPGNFGALENKLGGNKVLSTSTTTSNVKLGSTQKVNVTPHFNQPDKMWFEFDKFPGCFPYSSFIYMDAVAKLNACQKLTATYEDAHAPKNGQTLYKLYKTALNFKETGSTVPPEISYKWTTTDPNGKFYTSKKTATTGTSNSIITQSPEVYYTGTGTVHLELTIVKNNSEVTTAQAYLNACHYDITLPPVQVATCDQILVTQTPSGDIYPDSWTTFSTTAKDKNGNPFTGQIRYMVNSGNGLFHAADQNNPGPGLTNLLRSQGANAYLHALAVGPDGVVKIQVDGSNVPGCTKTFAIKEKPVGPVCDSLKVFNGATEMPSGTLLQKGTTYILKSVGAYIPPLTGAKSTFSTSQGLLWPVFPFPPVQPSGSIIVTDNTSVFFKTNTDATGIALKVEATTNDPAGKCVLKYSIVPPPACQSIEVFQVVNGASARINPGSDFQASGRYELKANLNFNPSMEDGLVTFTTTQGILFKPLSPLDLQQTQTVKEGESVFLIVPENAPSTTNAVTVKAASNDPSNACIAQFDILGAQPLEECKTLVVKPDNLTSSHQTFQLNESSSDLGNFNGNFEFSSECSDGKFTNSSGTQSNQFSFQDFVSGISYSGGCSDSTHSVSIKAVGDLAGTCEKTMTYTYHHGGGDTDYPTIRKCVYSPESGICKENGNADVALYLGDKSIEKYKRVTYKVTFTPNDATSAKIEETSKILGKYIGNGYLSSGSFDLVDIAIISTKNSNLDLVYKSEGFNLTNNVVIGQAGPSTIYAKDLKRDRLCSSLNNKITIAPGKIETNDCILGPSNTVENLSFPKLQNVDRLYVLYQYKNNSNLSAENCVRANKETGCGEKFDNTTTYSCDLYSTEKESNPVTVKVLCPYAITRESGDVFFHDELNIKPSLSTCSNIVDSTGLVIRPKKEPIQRPPSTGPETDVTYNQPTHYICELSNELKTDTNGQINIPEYNNPLKNFSSSVCEMRADVAKEWKEKYINQAIKNNITKLSRWDTITGNQNIEQLKSKNGVVVIENGDLTVGANGTFEIKGSADPNNPLPAAQTYIVKNGDLIIKNNIVYNDNYLANQLLMLTNPKNIPSVAFIVIDGNIEIAPNVTRIDGVLMAVDTTGEADGEIKAFGDTKSDNMLTINGSLIGNVQNIFENRVAITDPTQDEASIVVRYDERLLLNTPPGLSDLINISELRIAH